MDIGKPLRIYTVEPLETPVPDREAEPRPDPEPAREPQEEPAPASR